MTFTEWLGQFCAAMGWPASAANLAILNQWATFEGMFNPAGLAFSRGYNPFMTTMDGTLSTENIGFGPGVWNSAGVKMYATPEAGIAATKATFRNGGGPGWYGALDTAFASQTYSDSAARSWQIWIVGPNKLDAHGYDVDLGAYAKQQWASPPVTVPATTDTTVTAQLAAIIQALGGADALAAWNAKGNSLLLGYGLMQEQLQETANKVATLSAPSAVPPHRHTMDLAVASTGPVLGGK